MKLWRKYPNLKDIMTIRQEKLNSLIRVISSSFIKSKIAAGILATVTRVEITSDLKKAVIFMTVFPEEKESEVFEKIKKSLGELRDYAKPQIKAKFMPWFDVKIDEGEKNRQRIEEALKK